MTTKFDIIGIQDALIAAHNDGNTRAITKKDAQELGILDATFEMWVSVNNELRKAVGDFVQKKFHATEKDAPELRKIRNQIYKVWKKMLVRANGDPVLSGTMKVNQFDVDSLVGFAENYIKTDNGTAWTVQTALKFRKDCEAYIGCKMTENEVLGDEDRDAITTLADAIKMKEKAQNALNGYMKGKDKEPGILEKIAAKEGEVEKRNKQIIRTTELLKQADGEIKSYMEGILEGTKDQLKVASQELADLRNQKTQAEENIKKADKTIASIKDLADAATAKIKAL